MRTGKNRPGFTLIELLVVMTVIAILLTIAIPVFSTVQEKAHVTQDLNNLRQIGIATQTYLNDHDNILFTADGNWMTQLKPRYLPSWKIFQSPFDNRAASETDASAPVSYGINGTENVVGISMERVKKPSVFILFAPAQDSGTTVKFSGTPAAAVTVTNSSASAGIQNRRTRINAFFGDLHADSLPWDTFARNAATTDDPDADYRWTPDTPWP